MQRRTHAVAALAAMLFAACGGGGGGGGDTPERTPPAPRENPEFRAIAGISMGGYGALNLATKHDDVFGAVATLGGPVDLRQLLADTVRDGLEVKAQTQIPDGVGADFTFDHLPRYPGRNVQMSLFRDLVIAFGNPFLHHPDPARVYLASDSEPAAMRLDDEFGAFEIPSDPRGFLDEGDENEDGLRQVNEAPDVPVDVLLAARGSISLLAPETEPVLVGDRAVADLDGDGTYDVGDGLVVNLSEPIANDDGDFVYEPEQGETFDDFGLDGVPETADFGEGNGEFDYDPDRLTWIAEDPTSRLEARSAEQISRQRIYMDVGTQDQFGFALHYDNLVSVLRDKGLAVDVREEIPGNCISAPDLDSSPLLVRYEGGHTGIPETDDVTDQLLGGDVCGELLVWKRLLAMVGFLDQAFPGGSFGAGEILDFDLDIDIDDFDLDVDPNLRGQIVESDVPVPSLKRNEEDPMPTRRTLTYLPPKFFGSDDNFPIVYYLPGYGQEPDDYRRVGDLLDYLILTEEVQNMYVVFLSGAGGRQGSFYVNHRVPESQVPDVIGTTSGLYEDAILNDIIPFIENEVVDGRVSG